MGGIKIYKEVHDDNRTPPFMIKRMEDYWEKQQKEPDTPHRHNYYTVLLVLDAEGSHFIDFNEYYIDKNQVFFVSPGQVHQIIEKRQSNGYVMTFGQEFLASSNIPDGFLKGMEFFIGFGESPPLQLYNKEVEKLKAYCEEMVDLYSNNINYKQQAIGSLLQLFLIRCDNLCTLDKDNSHAMHFRQTLFSDFRQKVDEEYKLQHGINFYAEKLYVSADHLTRVIKSITGKSAKEFIQDRIITEAKRELYFTDKSSKEIGYELGFTEPAHFSSFFKNCTGSTPGQFRQKK
jgi:AraC-like DNA-binding protein